MLERDLLPGEYGVLGLLAWKPMHGYEMARFFDRDDLHEVCPVEQSLLYSYLRNLEGAALVTWKERRVGNRPPRKIFELTQQGRQVVFEWLRQPVDRLREIRLDFLLKLYLLKKIDPAAGATLLADQVQACAAYRDALAERAEDAGPFERLLVTSKVSAAEATLSWLKTDAAEYAAVEGRVADRQ